jgi:signal transduction histidine kinase
MADRGRVDHLNQELKEITSLYNIGVTVGASLNLDQVFWRLYKESSRLVNTSNFALIIYDKQTDSLNFVLVFERGQPVKSFRARRSNHQGPIDQVLSSQAPVLIRNMNKKSAKIPTGGINQAEEGRKTTGPVRSWLGVPILNPNLEQDEPQGIIVLWDYEPDAFTDHDLWLLSAVGTQAAIAIRNARLYETVLAERDRAVEAEAQTRQALARDLHDGPTQLVSAMMMRLDFCRLLLDRDPDKLPEEIEATQELARQAVQEIRTLLFELRPLILETDGLVAALQIFLERRQRSIGSTPRLILNVNTGNPENQIDWHENKVEATLFAIVQETVNNAVKHAQANTITVQVGETPTEIYITIADDGEGFEIEQVMSNYEQRGSLGMVSIQERVELIGGGLEMQSAPERGTRITVRVPKAKGERLKKRGGTGPLSWPLNLANRDQ